MMRMEVHMRFLFLVMLLWSTSAFAKIAPDNDLWLPSSIGFAGISEASFNRVLTRLENHYTPVANSMGYDFVINRLWEDGTVNSDTTEEDYKWIINSYGGLARYPGMTSAGYALVACHELGHHLGGAPLYPSVDWASDEGESDYWASKECMKALGYTRTQIQDASLVLAKVLASLGSERMPSQYRIDKSVVKATSHSHPKAQCRLDTYLSGVACRARGPMSKINPRVNSCFTYPTATTYKLGSRPRCWFAP